ncbi:hypothetical protein ACIPLA_10895 [Pseudomonas sp. NPDC086112]|uniref:hypothetical protein n=1 Tax=Pseudomonas sp. NPDC086112 TaxID=3364430 RepID=UPI00381B0889
MSDFIDPDANRSYRTYIPQELLDNYSLELGRMLHKHSQVETIFALRLNRLISETAEPTWPHPDTDESHFKPIPQSQIEEIKEAAEKSIRLAAILTMLTEGLDTEKRCVLIPKIMKVMDYAEEDILKLKAIITHFRAISKVRNLLVHNGATPNMTNKEDWFCTSNNFVHSNGSVKYFQPSTLTKIRNDLELMEHKISMCLDPGLQDYYDSDPNWSAFITTPDGKAWIQRMNDPWSFSPKLMKDHIPEPVSPSK